MPDLTAEASAASRASVVRRAPLVFLDFPDNPIRAWGGIGNLQWGGYLWIGVGHHGGISGVEQTVEIKASKVDFALAGIPLCNERGEKIFDMVDEATNSNYQGRAAEIFIAFFDEDMVIIPEPKSVWLGRMDVPTIRHDGSTISVKLTAEHEFADLDRSRTRRYTLKDQQERFEDDLGCEFVTSLQEVEILWGRQKYD